MRNLRNMVMLPLLKAGYSASTDYLLRGIETGKLYYGKAHGKYPEVVEVVYLYFTAPSIEENWIYGEEIKVGDWIISTKDNKLERADESWIDFLNIPNLYWRKVIATNNPELWEKFDFNAYRSGTGYKQTNIATGIAKIPLDFVERFVKEQGNIKQVMLEYEEYDSTTTTGVISDIMTYPSDIRLRPVLNNNGAVKVFPLEEKKYSLDEMMDNMQYYMEYCKLNNIYTTPQDWLKNHKHF